MTEEQRFGGYCVFDMTFAEYGALANVPEASTAAALTNAADNLYSQTTNTVNNGPPGPTP